MYKQLDLGKINLLLDLLLCMLTNKCASKPLANFFALSNTYLSSMYPSYIDWHFKQCLKMPFARKWVYIFFFLFEITSLTNVEIFQQL